MKWLIILLSILSAHGKDITILWDPSGTPGVYYRVIEVTQPGSIPVVLTTTTGTNATISFVPAHHILFVTALATNGESDPSNLLELPPLPSVPTGTTVSTNLTPITQLIQAEAGAITAPMSIVQVLGANGSAVRSATANSGTAAYSMTLSGGAYVVWARIIADATSRDSFFVSVDGTNEDVFGNEAVLSANWQWRKVNGGNGGPVRIFNLPAGVHTFTFRGREAGIPLDALYITTDMNFIPQ